MSYSDVQDVKDILFLVTATYAAYQAYVYLCEQEKRSAVRKKRRMQALARSRANEGDSTSTDEECDIKPMSTAKTEITDEQQVVGAPQALYSVEHIRITNPRTLKRKKAFSSAVSGDFFESIASKFSDKQFKKHFRVSRQTMDKLHDRFASSIEYKNIFKLGDKTRIPAKYYMMMFLWFAGKRCSYLDLSKVFNVPLSRSCSTVDTVMQFFVNCSRDYIRFPETPSDKRVSAENFQEISGFPDVIGCLVNNYIEVQAPVQESKGSYPTKESIVSTIQAICDSKGRFLDVFVDASRKVHHTEIMQASPIAGKLKEICQGRYHVLAEGEYYIREWLLTPFKEPILPEQTLFNQKHRSTMEGVSDSLEILQSRFQQLISMAAFSSYKVKQMIIACCVLQNICLEEDDRFDEGDPLAIFSGVTAKEALTVDDAIADDTHLRRMGELKRRQIMEELKMI